MVKSLLKILAVYLILVLVWILGLYGAYLINPMPTADENGTISYRGEQYTFLEELPYNWQINPEAKTKVVFYRLGNYSLPSAVRTFKSDSEETLLFWDDEFWLKEGYEFPNPSTHILSHIELKEKVEAQKKGDDLSSVRLEGLLLADLLGEQVEGETFGAPDFLGYIYYSDFTELRVLIGLYVRGDDIYVRINNEQCQPEYWLIDEQYSAIFQESFSR